MEASECWSKTKYLKMPLLGCGFLLNAIQPYGEIESVAIGHMDWLSAGKEELLLKIARHLAVLSATTKFLIVHMEFG